MKRFDIVLYLGTSYSATIFLDDIDLSSGYTAELKIKEHPLYDDVIFSTDTDEYITLTEQGELKIEIPHDAEGIPLINGIYDCIMTNTDTGEKSLVIFGYYYPNILASSPS